jgi:hypothetical protein
VDWRRLSRWAFLGVVVMVLWLLAPVAKCSYAAFRDTPLTEYDAPPADPADADRKRVEDGKDFAGSLVHAVRACYARTPLFGQEDWKGDALIGLIFLSVLGWLVHGHERRRHNRTLGDRR